eukprot:883176-Rhodomonas_salina.1
MSVCGDFCLSVSECVSVSESESESESVCVYFHIADPNWSGRLSLPLSVSIVLEQSNQTQATHKSNTARRD